MENNQTMPFDDNELSRIRNEYASYLAGIEIPTSLIEIWERNNGFYLDSVEFYSSKNILARNELLEVRDFCPNYIAIANDTGSRVALLKGEKDADTVCLNYAGSMAEMEMENTKLSVKQWIEKGCPFELDKYTEISAVKPVVIKLDTVPSSGIKGLMEIRKLLGLSIPLGELRSISDALPYELCSTTYIKALRLASKINVNGKIISIWSKEFPSAELPLKNLFDN